ncbi:SpoIIE family protein phosphatase [Nocardioides anomalus]|uniref:SpoIIE family protein phosphatase n=1 Tax=Nocardioides anomalus TaxID=2712223 RepID=A0A6G6WET4_9ACTN|nr:SpoIIE family protein phosphatase [Nocardioides anomalus]QIG43615.1 SpoIIE family protein phosphatase [Nocardioides anomalus]
MTSAATELRVVIGDAPAAVLLVNLAAGEVVHANDVAQQLAPGTSLPLRIDAWSEAAGLRDPGGEVLSETEHPLSRLLRSEPVPGQAVTAQRRSEMGAEREPLWVVGVPMTGAPGMDEFALVVFLAVHEQEATAAVEALAQREATLRDRAVLATGLSFTVADARDPHLPLVWVNQAFTTTTGYGFDEAVGRNCRFLQGPGTDPESVARVREALQAGEGIVTTLLNYTRDGLAFWNQVIITPILDAEGQVTHFVGVQSDVSGRVEADRERDRALAVADAARREAEQAQARLALLAEATEVLSGQLDEAEARARMLRLLAPALADTAMIFHCDATGSVVDHQARHRDPALSDTAQQYAAQVREQVPPTGLVRSLLDGAPYRLVADTGALAGTGEDFGYLIEPGQGDGVGASLRMASALVIALPGRHHVRDVLVLARAPERPAFTEDDALLGLDLGRRSGLILENLRLYASKERIARTLQSSLLSAVPELPWLEVDARYLPGAGDAEVGGDFLDFFQHDDHSIGVAVGDVEGHDIHAAAAMGQLKGLFRATALTHRLLPAAVLEQVDQLLQLPGSAEPVRTDADHESRRLASTLFLHLEPPTPRPPTPYSQREELQSGRTGDWPSRAAAGGPGSAPATQAAWTLTLSSAGHLPPLVRLPDGQLTFLDPPHARGPLLGVGGDSRRRHDATFALPAGSVLLLYTDGLIERSGETLDAGMDRLLEVVSRAPDRLEGFVDHVLRELIPTDRPLSQSGLDDTVVVALCLREREQSPPDLTAPDGQ